MARFNNNQQILLKRSVVANMEKDRTIQTLERILRESCEALGLQKSVIIVKVLNEVRWILHYEQDPDKPDFGDNMIKLERHIRAKLEGQPIELLLESKADRNRRDIKSGRLVEEKTISARGVESLED